MRGKFKSYIEGRQSNLEKSIVDEVPPKSCILLLLTMSKLFAGTGIKSYIIKATEEGKSRAAITILLQSKGMSNGSAGKREDPHELMTAILIREKIYVLTIKR